MIYDTLEIGRRIQKLRREKGLTQEQLAERLNVSTVHLAKIETGKRGCSLDILLDFASFFNASLDYLVLGKVSDSEVRGAAGCHYPNPGGFAERYVTGRNKTSGWYSCAIRISPVFY